MLWAWVETSEVLDIFLMLTNIYNALRLIQKNYNNNNN